MFNIIKKLFGFGSTQSDSHPLDGATRKATEAPYKLEPPVLGDIPVLQPVQQEATTAVESKPAKKPASKKPAAATAAKKTAAKTPAVKKPAVKKPAVKTAKKPTATKTTKTTKTK